MNTVISADYVAPAKPFSDTVLALLRFTKQQTVELNLHSVHNCLRELYHPEMQLKDVIVVMLSAIKELSSIQEFAVPCQSFLVTKLTLAPLEGTSCLGGMFGPKREDKFSVVEFYDSIIKQMLYVFRFSNVAWCSQYVFPERVATHEHQS